MTPAQTWVAIRTEVATALQGTRLRLAEGIPYADVDSRTVVVGPPAFSWRGQCDPDVPDLATFTVWVIERADERAIENLLDYLPELMTALQDIGDDSTITDGPRPAAYPAGAADLPAYMMTIELGL